MSSVEAVAVERADQLALLVGEVGERRVGEEVDRAAHGLHALLVPGDEGDERAVHTLEQVGDRLVLPLSRSSTGPRAGSERRRCGKMPPSSRVWWPVTKRQ